MRDSAKPSPPGLVILDTKGISPETGFDYWRELFAGATIPTRIEKNGTGMFSAYSRAQLIGELGIISNSCLNDFAIHFHHGKSEIARSHDKLSLLVTGTSQAINIGYRNYAVTTLRIGDWFLASPDDPFWVSSNRSLGNFVLLEIPRHFGSDLHPPPEGLTGHRMSSAQLFNRLVANYVQTLAAGGPIADACTSEAISRNLLELITLAFHTNAETREACGNGLASGLLLAISQYLDAHYAQPGFSVSQVAKRFGITPRYVHMLFERNHTTFSEQLYRRRLEHAHSLLIDPLQRHLSITDIAYRCGFNDLTHFGRRYRQMYDQLPREARAQTI